MSDSITTPPPPTGCSGGVTSYPYNQSFESSVGDWSQEAADDLDWTVNSGGTPSSGTGPGGAADGSTYIYVEASGSGTGFPDKRAILNSPCFDFTNAFNKREAYYNFIDIFEGYSILL